MWMLPVAVGISVYFLGVFFGMFGSTFDIPQPGEKKWMIEYELGGLAEPEVAGPEVAEPKVALRPPCDFDILYDVWSSAESAAGLCRGETALEDCCNDDKCAGFLQYSDRGSQCYRFGQVPEALLETLQESTPLELFDRMELKKDPKWSFFLKRPVRVGQRSTGHGLPAKEQPEPVDEIPREAAEVESRGGDDTAKADGVDKTEGDDIEVADEVHVVFTADCRPFNLWQHEFLFFSALRVEQPGPITAIISGCSEETKVHHQKRHEALRWPARFKQYFTPKFNDARSMWLSKPYGVRHWFKRVGPSREVVAVVDPDFIFLRPLTARLDSSVLPREWTGPVPPQVQKGVVVGQRYANIPHGGGDDLWDPQFTGHDMNHREFMSWVCSGDPKSASSCNNLTIREMGNFHSSGVPYLAHSDDWEWLVDAWAEINERLHKYAPQGYYVDMYSWSLANAHMGKRQFILENLMLSSAETPYEDWTAVDALHMDVCHAEIGKALSHVITGSSAKQVLPGHQVAPFLHYCLPIRVPYPSFQSVDDYRLFSKYWFDWGLPSGERHALERCEDTADTSTGPFGPSWKWLQRSPPKRVLPNESMARWELRDRFLACTTKAVLRQAARRFCAGRPLAQDVLRQTEPLDE